MVTVDSSIAEHNSMGWRFDNTYLRLPDVFFESAKPARVKSPLLVILNSRLATELGLNVAMVRRETEGPAIVPVVVDVIRRD